MNLAIKRKPDTEPVADSLEVNAGPPPIDSEPETAVISDLIEENGHLLFDSLEVKDWQKTLQEQRKAGVVSPRDTYTP